MSKPHIAILGAGPAGLGAAWRLRAADKATVEVIEQGESVGGNAGSFDLDGLPVDYGSHRLHPSCDPAILNDIRDLLGKDLLDRPRHGRIRLRGRWIHFPLKPVDLILRLPWSFGLGVARDATIKNLRIGRKSGDETFASVLKQGLGKTICRDFYFPYAWKMWGMAPELLSATQARRRVSAGSLGRMIRKVFGVVPGFRAPGSGRFYYPNRGFGQISQAIAEAAKADGADIKLRSRVTKIVTGDRVRIEVESDGTKASIEADYVWSTIPLAVLARLVEPSPPSHVLESAASMDSRAMVLIYLVLGQDQFSPYDAHYFPERDIQLTRLSEPKNYSDRSEPKGWTVLCGELPCDQSDDVWSASDDALGEIVKDSLSRCGLPVKCPVIKTVVRRLPHAYPIYKNGYEQHFDVMDHWATDLPNVLSFGRQGLFAHDNTHHALAMAYGAVDCLRGDGSFDAQMWESCREAFATHVVED